MLLGDKEYTDRLTHHYACHVQVASLADVSALLQSHFVLLRPDAPEALDIIAS